MHVYMWHDSHANAIKIGHGDNPRQRMLDYARGYGMQPDTASLIEVEIPVGIDREYVESVCHKHALDAGLKNVTKNGAMQEVFMLGSRTYADVSREIEHVVQNAVVSVMRNNAPDLKKKRGTQIAPPAPPTPPQPLPEPEVPALYYDIGRHGLEAPAGYVASPPVPRSWSERHSDALAKAWLTMMGACVVLFVAAMVLR